MSILYTELQKTIDSILDGEQSSMQQIAFKTEYKRLHQQALTLRQGQTKLMIRISEQLFKMNELILSDMEASKKNSEEIHSKAITNGSAGTKPIYRIKGETADKKKARINAAIEELRVAIQSDEIALNKMGSELELVKEKIYQFEADILYEEAAEKAAAEKAAAEKALNKPKPIIRKKPNLAVAIPPLPLRALANGIAEYEKSEDQALLILSRGPKSATRFSELAEVVTVVSEDIKGIIQQTSHSTSSKG